MHPKWVSLLYDNIVATISSTTLARQRKRSQWLKWTYTCVIDPQALWHLKFAWFNWTILQVVRLVPWTQQYDIPTCWPYKVHWKCLIFLFCTWFTGFVTNSTITILILVTSSNMSPFNVEIVPKYIYILCWDRLYIIILYAKDWFRILFS